MIGQPEGVSRPRITWRALVLVVLLGLVGGSGGFLVASFTPAVYRSTSTLLVGDLTKVDNLSKEDLEASAQVATTYGLLLRTQPVLGPAADKLGGGMAWQTLRDHVHVDVINQNSLINMTVTGTTPEQAMDAATAVISSLQELTPAGSASEGVSVGEFAQRRFDDVQSELLKLDDRMALLRERRDAATTPAAKAIIQQAIDRIFQRMTLLQQSLVALANLASSAASSNTLTILQAPTSPISRTRPNVRADIGIGAAIGVIAALTLITYARGRKRRRAGVVRARPAPGSSAVREPEDPWVAELSERSPGR